MTKKQDKTVSGKPIETGVAWYRKDQWDRLLAVSADRSVLEDTYEEWVDYAQHAIRVLENQGVRLIKVDVDVDELVRWCTEQNREVNGEARADLSPIKSVGPHRTAVWAESLRQLDGFGNRQSKAEPLVPTAISTHAMRNGTSGGTGHA